MSQTEKTANQPQPTPPVASAGTDVELRSYEFRRGKTVIFAALVGIGFGLAAMPFYTVGIFAPHLARAFGWSVSQIMAGLSLTSLTVIVAGPIAGILAERYGTRPVAMVSQVLLGLSFLSLTTLSSLTQYYVTWVVLAAGGAGTLPITWTRTVNRWFDAHKGLALGAAMSGTGLFGILSKPSLTYVIAHYGWRAGYGVMGALPLLIALPIAALWFREPEQTVAAGQDALDATGLSRGQALRTGKFWLIALILVPISFALAGPVPNLEAILTDRGLTPAAILSITPLIGLFAIIGRLAGGWLLDHVWAPAVAFVILGMPSLSCAILAHGHLDHGTATAAVVLLGFALGVEYDVVAYITARYFGMRAYSGIYAVFYICFSIGAGLAPLAYGMIRDADHDFARALWASALILPVMAALFMLLGRYPDPKTWTEEAPT